MVRVSIIRFVLSMLCVMRGRLHRRGDYKNKDTPGEAASLQEAPPPDPLPKSSWGSRGIFLHTWFPLLGAVGYLLLGCGHGG